MTKARVTAWIDAAFSGIFLLLCVLAIYAANEAAADAVRRYGHNVDSGAILYFIAIIYLAPAAALFALGSCALFLEWQIRWYVHWFAVLCVVAPVILDLTHVFTR